MFSFATTLMRAETPPPVGAVTGSVTVSEPSFGVSSASTMGKARTAIDRHQNFYATAADRRQVCICHTPCNRLRRARDPVCCGLPLRYHEWTTVGTNVNLGSIRIDRTSAKTIISNRPAKIHCPCRHRKRLAGPWGSIQDAAEGWKQARGIANGSKGSKNRPAAVIGVGGDAVPRSNSSQAKVI